MSARDRRGARLKHGASISRRTPGEPQTENDQYVLGRQHERDADFEFNAVQDLFAKMKRIRVQHLHPWPMRTQGSALALCLTAIQGLTNVEDDISETLDRPRPIAIVGSTRGTSELGRVPRHDTREACIALQNTQTSLKVVRGTSNLSSRSPYSNGSIDSRGTHSPSQIRQRVRPS